MSASLKLKAYTILSDPRSLRLALFGLALAGLVASLGSPDPVLACSPAGNSGGGTCTGT